MPRFHESPHLKGEACDCESAYAMHFCSSPTLLSGRWVGWRGLQDIEIPELSQPRALAETCPPVTMQQPTNSTASFERVNCLDEHDFRKLLGFRSRSDCSDGDGLPVNRACAMVPEQKAPIAQPWAVSRTPRQTLPLRGSLAQSRYFQGAKPDSEVADVFGRLLRNSSAARGGRPATMWHVGQGLCRLCPFRVLLLGGSGESGCDLTSRESDRDVPPNCRRCSG